MVKKTTCYVQLGRAGDVLNILPLAYRAARQDRRPTVMVASEFSGILDGVSYADRLTWFQGYEQLPAAIEVARQHFDDVRVTQLHCSGAKLDRKCASNMEDAWLAGGETGWGTEPMVFDRRSPSREAELCNRFPKRKRWIIVSTSGYSAGPFARAHREELLSEIRGSFSDNHEVIDISDLRAERLFDLLGLFERAACLVLNDSAPLHLAAACHTPTVALLTNPRGAWYHCPKYHNQVARLEYPREKESLVDSVRKALCPVQ